MVGGLGGQRFGKSSPHGSDAVLSRPPLMARDRSAGYKLANDVIPVLDRRDVIRTLHVPLKQCQDRIDTDISRQTCKAFAAVLQTPGIHSLRDRPSKNAAELMQ